MFVGAFMRNARALVELHRADLAGAALALVNEAIAMTDADLGPDEQLLHRSVLLYNRAQILDALADYEGALRDYDVVISRDPEYGDYYFERAGVYRSAGRYEEALADYATAIRLSPPFHEAHYNRADLLRELGDERRRAARPRLRGRARPGPRRHPVNRVDLLLERGETSTGRGRRRRRAGAGPGEREPAVRPRVAARGVAATPRPRTRATPPRSPRIPPSPRRGRTAPFSPTPRAGSRTPSPTSTRRSELADDPWLRLNRAIALHDLDEHQRAVADLDIAVAALGDEDPDLLYRRGASRHALGDTAGARADWSAHLVAYGERRALPVRRRRSGGDGERGMTSATSQVPASRRARSDADSLLGADGLLGAETWRTPRARSARRRCGR